MKTLWCIPLSVLVITGCSQGHSDVNSQVDAVKPKEQVQVTATEIQASSIHKLDLSAVKQESKMQQGVLSGELQVSVQAGFMVTLLITNNQSYGVPIQYRSGMTADLRLLDPQGQKLWAWSDTMMFTQAIRDVVIPAGKVTPVRFKLPKEVLSQVKSKGYSLEATFAGHATETSTRAMSEVRLSLDAYIN